MCVKACEDEAFNAGTLPVSIQIRYLHIVHGVCKLQHSKEGKEEVLSHVDSPQRSLGEVAFLPHCNYLTQLMESMGNQWCCPVGLTGNSYQMTDRQKEGWWWRRVVRSQRTNQEKTCINQSERNNKAGSQTAGDPVVRLHTQSASKFGSGLVSHVHSRGDTGNSDVPTQHGIFK